MAKLVPVLGLLLAGCNPPSASTGSAPAGKKKNDAGTSNGGVATCLAIVNGQESESEPAVGMLWQRDGDQLFVCTGTFVSPNTMITAAHCFPFSKEISYAPGTSWDLTDPAVVDQVGKASIKSVKTIVSPLKVHNGTGISSTDSQKDLAVVIFPDGTAPATLPILGRGAEDGEAAEIYGFGRTEIDTVHAEANPGTFTKKRHGRNKVFKKPEMKASYPNTLMLVGSASGNGSTGSLASNGDSGGPLIVAGAVAGIASTAAPTEGLGNVTTAEAFTVYADLAADFAISFYKQAEKEGAVFTYSNDAAGQKISSAADRLCD